MSDEYALWKPRPGAMIPKGTETPEGITKYAKQLSKRDVHQIVHAFEAEHYEMVTTFVWTKAMASLKRKLATLGSEFVGEMLGRPDISADDNLVQVVTDDEALRLATELGMFNRRQAMSLRHAMELVQFFADPPESESEDEDHEEGIERHEAIGCLSASIKSILGHGRLEVAVEFASFRRRLEEDVFDPDSEEIEHLAASPYFFQRTTLRVLLALVKTGTGVQLDHALGNFDVILRALWEQLLKADRWDVGRTYAEVHNEGRTRAAAAIQRTLLRVHGFDYVPENLRSMTFISAANKVFDAHFGWSNYHNEPAPMRALAALGTVIPMPALARCMTAILCVKLGNRYGVSRAAQPSANKLLETLTMDQWAYYLNECLPADSRILDKLKEHKPCANWISLVRGRGLSEVEVENEDIGSLVRASKAGKGKAVIEIASRISKRLG